MSSKLFSLRICLSLSFTGKSSNFSPANTSASCSATFFSGSCWILSSSFLAWPYLVRLNFFSSTGFSVSIMGVTSTVCFTSAGWLAGYFTSADLFICGTCFTSTGFFPSDCCFTSTGCFTSTYCFTSSVTLTSANFSAICTAGRGC